MLTILRSSLALLFVVGLSLTPACSGDATGKYARERNTTDYLELRRDGTYIVFQGSRGFTGKYEIQGGEIILKTDQGFAQRGKIDGEVIVDPEGERWVRR